MRLVNLLTGRKSAIKARWQESILSMYPAGTALFLKQKSDTIANPVGSYIREGVETIFQGLVEGRANAEMQPAIENLIKVRALQEFFHPASAVGFLFMLKYAVRQELAGVRLDRQDVLDLMAFESRIDDLVLLACVLYRDSRELLHAMRAAEIGNRTSRLLERANLMHKIPRFRRGHRDKSTE
jgi:hypothetical protein